ncbi:MAG: sensor histidine kinase [Roseibacillus sp.]
MRLILCTLAPMLAAAILAVVGGERLSRRESNERTPHDRERLFDFSASLQIEIQRLESLYLTRLDNIASTTLGGSEAETKAVADQTIGIPLVEVFRVPRKDRSIRVTAPVAGQPEIVMAGRDHPLNPQKAVTLSSDTFGSKVPAQGVWLPTPNPDYRVHYRSPDPDQVVAFVIDFEEVANVFQGEMQKWVTTPATPLVEAEERVQVRFQDQNLLSSGNNKQGPAAAIIPFRTIFGDLEIRAWDRIKTSSYRDTTTLILTTALALFLITSGVILYWHQRRTLRLAGERVSFVNRVSHELGSPLTNLALNIDLANQSLPHNPARASKRLSIVTEEIERLSRLVANVLTFSHQEKETLQLHKERVLVHQIVAEVIDSFRPSFARRKIEIETELATLPTYLLDPDALRQILGNLLSNIEKYAFSGQWSKVSLSEQEGQLILEVSDRGVGIPTKENERIFQPFERVHRSTSEGSSGTGLGLSIARELAEKMQGSLELLDTETGCTFRLALPAKPALAVVNSDSSAA